MTRTTTYLAAIVFAAAPAFAGPGIMIDSFTDMLESETFITGLSGGVITRTGERSGLEVGMLMLPVAPTNDEVGEPVPAYTERWQETQSQLGLAGVLGGARDSHLIATTDTLGSDVSVAAGYGGLYFSTAFGTQGIATLVYGKAASLNTDFSVLPDGAFEFELTSGDLTAGPRPIPATITVTSGAGTGNEATASMTLNLVDEQLYSFPFTNFAGVDFADIDRIELELDQSDPITAAADFALGEFYAIPEPATLMALGLTALLLRRR